MSASSEDLIRQAKSLVGEYIEVTECTWCIANATVVKRALNEILELHLKAHEFMALLENSENLNALVEVCEDGQK